MIGDINDAKRAQDMALTTCTDLNGYIECAMNSLPEAEFLKFRCATGKIVSEIMEEILFPIYATHPELVERDTPEHCEALLKKRASADYL